VLVTTALHFLSLFAFLTQAQQLVSLQQLSGLNEIFYIDAPGPHNFAVDSITLVENFSAHLCRNDNPKNCIVLPWFVKIVVKPGAFQNPEASIDTVNSDAGTGTKSIAF
jgi:hypothetical protein